MSSWGTLAVYRMRKVYTLLLSALLLWAWALPDFGRWYPYPEALALAQAHGRMVMVYFHSEHCPYCQQMNTFVLSDPGVSRLLEARFVVASVSVDTPEGQELARRYRVPGTPTFVFLVPKAGAGSSAAGPGRSSSRSSARCASKEVRVDRRTFLKATGAALGALALSGLPARAQGLEGEDLEHLEQALKEVFGKGFKDLTPSDAVKLNMPAIAESGANVPAEVEVALPKEQVKAIHLFADKNPTPHILAFMPMKAEPYYATRVRLAETTAIRAVVETQDGKLLLASASTRVTVGGCG